MPATLQTVQALSKEIYGPHIVDTLDDEAVLSTRIEKTGRGVISEVGGKYVTFPIRVRRNAGIGYRNPGEKLQNAGQQGYLSVRIPLRYGYGRVHIEGQVMDLVDTNYNAFEDAMEREMSGLKEDIAKDTNRVMYGDGQGTLAIITVDSTITANEHTVDSLQFIEEGFQVDVLDPATGTLRTGAGNIQVIAVDEANSTVTFSDAFDSVDTTSVITRHGNWQREPHGLTSLVDDGGELFSLNGDDERRWRSSVDSNGGTPRAISEGLMIAMCDTIRRKGGGTPTAIFAGLEARRAYWSLLSQQRRFNENKKFEGGLHGLAFNYGAKELPVVEENDAPPDKMWFLQEPRFAIYRDKKWDWLDRDGSIWKWVADYDAYQALMKQYWEFALESRHNHGVIEDIQAG